jgi:AcrR family transcriptional regulator
MTRKNPERRRELMAAAQHLFYTNGYENTSVNDIIKAVGVSKGAFYHHFDSKTAVLEAIVAQLMDQAITKLQEIIADESLTAVTKWQKVVQHSNSWKLEKDAEIIEVGGILRADENILLHHKLRSEWLKVSAHKIAEIIEQGVTEGVFSVEYIPETAVILLTVTNSFNDAVGELIANPEKFDHPAALALQKYAAMQTIIERLLGASTGSIPIVDEETLIAWFDNP